MKDNVVDISGRFTPKQETVYTCSQCSGQAFWLNEGGTVTCRTCSGRQKPDLEWVKDALGIHEEAGNVVIDWDEKDE